MSDESPSIVVWTSEIYPRFQFTKDDAERIKERFLDPGILTTKDIAHELHKAQCWLRDNPGKAKRRRSWYKFFRNWLEIAEDNKRARRGSYSNAASRGGGGTDQNARRRILGLDGSIEEPQGMAPEHHRALGE